MSALVYCAITKNQLITLADILLQIGVLRKGDANRKH